eukprot:5440234-Pyramimonas_sp.AAC.1
MCRLHRRCYDCIYRDSITEEAKKDGTNERFVNIFGDDKQRKKGFKDKTTAYRVIADFGVQFPEGTNKTGVKRGKIDLAQYVHSEGVEARQFRENKDPILDKELFTNKLQTERGWTPARALELWECEWARGVWRKHWGGPPWSKEQMEVPANMFGGESNTGQAGTYESKALLSSSKASTLRDEDKKKIKDECHFGFNMTPIPCDQKDLSR